MCENSSPIVKCSHCKKILSREQFNLHKCDLQIVGQKDIPVIEFMDVSCDGKKLMMGQGIDGILYTFEIIPREPIPFVLSPSDDSYHGDENRRKVNRTLFRTIYSLYKGV